jgi:hypothetical protein
VPIIVLDSAEGIKYDTESSALQNAHALSYLPVGLHRLAETVRRHENQVPNLFGGDVPDMMAFGFPNSQILSCFFAWFAVSLVNYLRLVALIKLLEDKEWRPEDLRNKANHASIKSHCTAYVRRVIPSIYRWRNKVAAHFAITDPFHDDSLGTLEVSLFEPITYNRPYFKVGTFSWRGGTDASERDPWALTETFETLAPRLWPDKKLEPLTVSAA